MSNNQFEPVYTFFGTVVLLFADQSQKPKYYTATDSANPSIKLRNFPQTKVFISKTNPKPQIVIPLFSECRRD